MKKILFVSDGDNFPKGAMRLISQLHENEYFLVKGIFYASIGFEEIAPIEYLPGAALFVKERDEEIKVLRAGKERFVHECENSRIRFQVQDQDEAWDKDQFAKETRFADLVVISERLFYSNFFNGRPNYFMEEALHAAECPIIVVPDSFQRVDRVAVAYDGKKESMFAVKQFTNLFPQYTDLPSEFVYIKNDGTDDIPDLDLLKEYASSHFNSVGETKLNFDERKYFATWLEEKKNAIVVTGSYARSAISNSIKKSFTDGIIRDRACPVFIAHSI